MRNKKFTKNELINLLVKKATGFYYDEEQLEYEIYSKNSKKNEAKSCEENKFEKNLKNDVRVSGNINKTDDMMNVSSEITEPNIQGEKLNLTKKKVSTHFVPPDMIAIKILFEIFDKKVNNNEIENISDEELIKLKTKLLEELKNDNI